MWGYTTARLIVIVLVVQLAECAAGSCLSYGHSCWGAHGKRSGNGNGAGPEPEDARWFLSRLIPSRDNQWQLHNLPDSRTLQQQENESANSASSADLTPRLVPVEEQEDEEGTASDLILVTDNDGHAPHRLALYRILNPQERKLEQSRILSVSP